MAKQEDSTPMTAEQAQDYFQENGAWCPYCQGANIDGGPVDVEGGAANQTCTCANCGKSWTDVYHLAAFIDDSGKVLDAEPVADVATDAAKLTRLARLSDSLNDFSKTLDEASALFGARAAERSVPRIIVEVRGGVAGAIASDVPIDKLNVSVFDHDNLNAMDAMPDENLSPGQRFDREYLRRLRDEITALRYNEAV